MKRWQPHITRLTLAVLLAGALGAGGMILYQPRPGIAMEGSLTYQVLDPAAAAQQRLTLVLPLEQRQKQVWPLVRRLARKHFMDPALVMAIIQVESSFFPLAHSPRGAQGLMQINPVTARHLGLTNPLDPEANLEAGIAYLAKLRDYFEGDLEMVLAAYNAGPTRVLAAGGVPEIEETHRFVDTVREQMDLFRSRFMSVAKF